MVSTPRKRNKSIPSKSYLILSCYCSNSRFRDLLELDVVQRRHAPIQGFHRPQEQHFEQTAEALPQFSLRPQARAHAAEQLPTPLLDLIHREGQEHQQG